MAGGYPLVYINVHVRKIPKESGNRNQMVDHHKHPVLTGRGVGESCMVRDRRVGDSSCND